MSQSSQSPSNSDSIGNAASFPIETDILILPDGTVVIADLPRELDHLRAVLAACVSPEPPGVAVPPEHDEQVNVVGRFGLDC